MGYNVTGGYSHLGSANNNHLTINGGTIDYACGGLAGNKANENVVVIENGTINTIYGGHSWNAGEANKNSVTIKGETISGAVYGGDVSFDENGKSGTVSENEVNINGGTINGLIFGGSGYNGASKNRVIINGGEINNSSVFAVNSQDGDATDNYIEIYNNPDLSNTYLGGYYGSPTTHSGNALNIYTKNLTAQNIANFDNLNFYLDSNINNGDTILTLTGGTQTDLSSTDIKVVVQDRFALADGDSVALLANESGIANFKSSWLDIQDSEIDIQEGVSYTYTAQIALSKDKKSLFFKVGDDDSTGGNDNTDENNDNTGSDDNTSGNDNTGGDDNTSGNDNTGGNNDNTDGNDNTGGNNDTPTTPVDDSNNTVNLTSGGENAYGGNTDSGNAQNNTVNFYSGTYSNIYGGYAPSGSTSGNTLNVYNKNLTAQNIYNFDTMKFYIPNDAVNGDTMLTLTDSAGTDVSNKNIRAGVRAGNSNTLKVGDTINLLTNSNGLTATGTTYGKLTEGVSLDYGLDVAQSGNSIVANITKVPGTLNEKTNIIPVTFNNPMVLVGNVLDDKLPNLDMSFDFDFEEDEESAQEIADVPNPNPPGFEVFADVGGGSLRTKTGAGSYVDMKTSNLDLGFARLIDNGGAGKLTFAPIFDYAHGNYDSYLSDGTHGEGTTKYTAGGGIFHNSWRNGFYIEGSFRVGKVKTDFTSDNLDTSGVFGPISYDTSATAWAGHFKIGKNLRMNRNNILNVYASYNHAHQGSMNIDLQPSKDAYHISSANSGKMKIGYRLTTRTSKISKIYMGMAYQYEHASGIAANYLLRNLSTGNAGENGSSGMLELGWLIKPLKNNPWGVDINATGWVGHQRGVTAMAKVSKAF